MLALVGSGEYLPGMEGIDRALLQGLGTSPRVVCLPTAAGTEGPARIAYWNELGVNHFRKLGAHVEAVSITNRKEANDEALVAPLRSANLVYLSGGRPEYLYATLQGTLAWQAITNLIENGGVLAGCSAGAMVIGSKIPGFPRPRQAFNLLPGMLVTPHFDEIPGWMVSGMRLLLLGNSLTLVGIDGYTALIFERGQYQVLGSGSVTLWDRRSRRRYTAGNFIEI